MPDRPESNPEIERKFLVHELPPDLPPGTKIRQGYLAVTADSEARVREEGGEYYLTVKSGKGESRAEIEVPLSVKVFRGLWPLTRGRRVRKVRHRLPFDGLTIEIDVYRRKLKGLVTAEVEFDGAERADAFRPPDWLGEEVTGDERFRIVNQITSPGTASGP